MVSVKKMKVQKQLEWQKYITESLQSAIWVSTKKASKHYNRKKQARKIHTKLGLQKDYAVNTV